jgi:hypothetical protein
LGHFGAWVDEGNIVAEEGFGGGGLGGSGGAWLGCGLAAAGVEDLSVERGGGEEREAADEEGGEEQ